MSDFELFEALARVRDHLYGAAEALDNFIQNTGKIETKDYDPEKIKWENAEGQKGVFERSEDTNSVEFKALRRDLAEHQGKLIHQGFFYWVFQNGVTVGRKRVK